ncbi:Hpt domain-containing protein [Gracilimonas halophila]|uniref:Hpt domain-containing protein n=1 Tax=Gracilimonas halophila TaxID=1834464 RepID=A0ABW5JJW6_9BACT
MNVIDLSYLENMTGGDNEVMIEMINLLLTETPKHLDNIKKAQDDKNWAQLRSEAHKVKPMFLYVGLSELNQICKDLEDNAKNEADLESNAELITRLETGFNDIVDDLKHKAEELA